MFNSNGGLILEGRLVPINSKFKMDSTELYLGISNLYNLEIIMPPRLGKEELYLIKAKRDSIFQVLQKRIKYVWDGKLTCYKEGSLFDIRSFSMGKPNNEFYQEFNFRGQLVFKINLTDDGSETDSAFYDSGVIKSVQQFKKGVEDGVSTEYFENGSMESKKSFKNGLAEGIAYSFYKDGKVSEKCIFKGGKIVGDILRYDSNGNVIQPKDSHQSGNSQVEPKSSTQSNLNSDDNEMVFSMVERMPSFNGGQEKLIIFLSQNIQYPPVCRENGIQGKVIVSCVVNKDGSLSDIEIQKSVDKALNDEALRVVRSMPNWQAGMQAGKPVRVKYNIPILFNLN